uniref:Mov10 like RISC complex RNA helicase 1 n=1 Tax=Astyanax mexicanus TaxID=7994 RepID=A0A8B9JVV3_ASTMX
MLTAVQLLISKLLSPLWRRAEDEDNEYYYGGGSEDIRQMRGGVVTQLCQDYGLIDHSVYFTAGEVLGGVPLCVGDPVHALAVRDGVHGGWRALRVARASLELDPNKLRSLIGTVTSCDKDGGFINQTTYFPRSALSEGFEPMKGDWVQAQYVISPLEWSSQARTVAPLRYRRMDKVYVSNIFGSNGIVEDSVFFSLDSLLLPAGYQPTKGDLVSVVVVESSQSFYCWRALCMAPIKPRQDIFSLVLHFHSTIKSSTLLENKEGLVVSEETQFGSMFFEETKELQVWIHNTSSETHTLKCCEFAGWDSEEQFTLGPRLSPSNHNTPSDPQNQQAISQKNPKGLVAGIGLFSLPSTSSGTAEKIKEGCETDSEVDKHGEFECDSKKCNKETPTVLGIERNQEIAPGEKVNLGCCTELLLLHFSSFTIGRRLEVSVNSIEENLLKPSTTYCPVEPVPQPQYHAQVVRVMAPAPPVRLARRHLPNFLGNYTLPQALRECVEAKKDVLVVQPALGEPLSLSSMGAHFSALLWLEELQAEKELREFSINGALLRKGTIYLHLEVPGLCEGRPSLFIGKKRKRKAHSLALLVLLRLQISEEDVSLRVNKDFQQSYLGEPLDVEFTYNRVTMRRCHCALEQAKHFGENGKLGLFGDIFVYDTYCTPFSLTFLSDLKTPAKHTPKPGQFFNSNLNPAQRQAVKRILGGECRPTPYVLFGPPGTGKTITLVEAILQVYHRVTGSRILVCTPSNSAADLICIRLHESGFLPAASLARVNATLCDNYSRAGEDIRNACFHRIVVSTCSSAGMFYQIGLRIGHFTHVFLDEAGQATEPEAQIPLGLLSERTGQIVLAGDPKQLGPVVKSKLAEAFGLGVSLLERLMANPLYSCSENGYNPLLVTKLVYNYRSHEVLLALPSRLFYGGELCVRSQRSVVDSLCHWSRLPTKGFPLIFHGVRGSEMREGSNPSWFNPVEAVQVMLYCCQLAKRLYNPIPATDIGIISPYRKQVEKIRVLLHKVGLGDIKVGSVEEFQGQEFLVIILSTVRSNEDLSGSDLQNVLGFLSNPKRFNVAITRSKALLITIGNPHVLIKEACFYALLQYAYDNGAYLGCDPPVSLRATHGLVTNTCIIALI